MGLWRGEPHRARDGFGAVDDPYRVARLARPPGPADPGGGPHPAGAGRRRLTVQDPALLDALLALI